MSRRTPESPLRYRPESWVDPVPLATLFPRSEQPVEIDVGSGKGRFILSRAPRNPDINYLGIDRMLRRIRKTARKAERAGLDNIRFLRLDAYYTVTYLIPPRSVQTYYVLFPDPWPKKKHWKNRLMNPLFLDAVSRTLIENGSLHFATDHAPYFEEVAELISQDSRFCPQATWIPLEEETTDFELMFRDQKPIHRLSLRLR